MCAQAVRLIGQSLRAGGCEPVITAQAAIDDLLMVDLDQSLHGETIKRRVEGPRLQPHPPLRDLLDVGDDAVAMLRSPGERRKDQERRLLHAPLSHADRIYR